jgi:hypothetical protein
MSKTRETITWMLIHKPEALIDEHLQALQTIDSLKLKLSRNKLNKISNKSLKKNK